MKLPSTLVFLLLVSACTEPRVKRYGSILDPLLGNTKKEDINRVLKVTPTQCKPDGAGETCEYRTAAARNEHLPITHGQNPAMGPDLSPLDYFDVILVTYDGLGIFKDWRSASEKITTP